MALRAYGLGHRILRTTIFQVGVAKDPLADRLMTLFKRCETAKRTATAFDPKRAAAGIDAFKPLKPVEDLSFSKDGNAFVHRLFFSANALSDEIRRLGGSWDTYGLSHRTNRDLTRNVFAVRCPQDATQPEWLALEKAFHRLHWTKESVRDKGQSISLFITASAVEPVRVEDFSRYVFIFSNSASVSMAMEGRRLGFYLGLQQNVCFYDPRGTAKSGGKASEGGYYNDIESVYDWVKENRGFATENIWLNGACLGNFAAGHLKAQLHNEGVNLIFENGCLCLYDDFIKPLGRIERLFAKRYWVGLSSCWPEKPNASETRFDLRPKWEVLSKVKNGKVVIISVANDQYIGRTATQRTIALAKHINDEVHDIAFVGNVDNPHFDRFFNHPESAAHVVRAIFSKGEIEPLPFPKLPYVAQSKRRSIFIHLAVAVAVFAIGYLIIANRQNYL